MVVRAKRHSISMAHTNKKDTFPKMDGDAELQPVTLNRRPTKSEYHSPKGSWIPKDNWARVALLFSFAQLLVCGGLELWIAITHYDFVTTPGLAVTKLEKLNGEAIFAYHVLFIFAQLFQLVLIGDAVSEFFYYSHDRY